MITSNAEFYWSSYDSDKAGLAASVVCVLISGFDDDDNDGDGMTLPEFQRVGS